MKKCHDRNRGVLLRNNVGNRDSNSNQFEAFSDTEAAAKMIQQLTGADMFQLRTEWYYRNAFWGTAATAWGGLTHRWQLEHF